MSLPVAIITGSTGHIGREVVKKLSMEGFNCICLGSRITPRQSLPLQFQTPGQRHQYMSLDLGKPLTSDMTKLLYPGINYFKENSTIQEELKLFQYKQWDKTIRYKLQLLVNIAGISQDKMSIKMTPEEITKMININLLNPMILSQLVAKQMYKESRKIGNAIQPCIINISSILGNSTEIEIQGTSIYGATKAGLTQYSQLFHNELIQPHHSHWPRIKNIQLGPVIDSDMVQQLSPTSQSHLIERGRTTNTLTTTREVALTVWQAYLSASP